MANKLGEHPLRQILSRILRTAQNPADFELAYVHRGAPDDRLTIRASEISFVGKGSFVLADGETQIPFHRILYVKDEERREFLWKKKTKDS